MDSIWLSIGVLALFSLCLGFFLWRNPIKRDRWLHAHSGFGLLWLSILIILWLLSTIWLVVECMNITPKELYCETEVLVQTKTADPTVESEVSPQTPGAQGLHEIQGQLTQNPEGPGQKDIEQKGAEQKDDAEKEVAKRTDDESLLALWNIVSQFLDPGNIHQARGFQGKLLSLICALLGVLCLSGLLISSLVNVISHRTLKWRKGLVTYGARFAHLTSFNKYVVIIGINEQTASLVRQSLRREGVKFVLIQTRRDVEKARLDLELKMDDELEDKIVFYSGERTSAEDIGKLRLEKAVEIFILGESADFENEKDHDSFNVNCLEHISNYFKEYKHWNRTWNKRVRVHVDFEYQSTFTAFKATHLYQKLDKDIEFVPFNVHETWAKKIFVDNFAIIPAGKNGGLKVQRYNPIDTYTEDGVRHGITKDCSKRVHLVILGMNQMGTALATQAALLCHFPNFTEKDKRRTTITFIDDHAKVEADYYIGRFSTLFQLSRHRIVICDGRSRPSEYSLGQRVGYGFDTPFFDPMSQTDEDGNGLYSHLLGDGDVKNETFLDVEWEFIQGNIASADIQNYIKEIAEDKEKTMTVAICFNNSQQSIASAMYLPEVIYKKANQVLVYQQNCFDLVDDIANGDVEWKRYPNLFPFGMIEGSYTENQFDNNIAKLLNLLYHKGTLPKDETLLKESDKAWEQMGIVQKLANINLADAIAMKYRSMGINNPYASVQLPSDLGAMAHSEHLRWVTERLMVGFRCLDKKEQEEFLNKPKRFNGEQKQRKRRFVNQLRAHVDICSNSRVKDVDNDAASRDMDRRMITNMPEILKMAEWASVLRLSDKRYRNSQHVGLLRFFLTESLFKRMPANFARLSFHFIDKPYDAFWMAEFPVTQAQWKRVMGTNMAMAEKIRTFMNGDMPVVNVSKQDVDDFLDILRKRTGLHFTLPSKDEWYYAAKKTVNSTKGGPEAYGAYSSMSSPLSIFGIKANRPVSVHRMFMSQRSGTGLRHILGNVWEWTRDKNEYDSFEFCGGSWRFTKLETELDQDYWHNAWEKEMKSDDLGFRLIWKFDVEGYGRNPLGKMLKPVKAPPVDTAALVSRWFHEGKNVRDDKTRNRMLLVKAGRFVMGANEEQDKEADKNERPRHIVEISHDYYVCEIPVTQYLWNLVMSDRKNPTRNRINDFLPQTDVTWDDAQLFIKRLNMMRDRLSIGLDGIEEMVFRLPTEAEWEYAAKGGHKKAYKYEAAQMTVPKMVDVNNVEVECDYKVKNIEYFLYAGSNDASEVAWFGESVIRDAGLKKPNDLGLYDMSGNIWEWCHDFYKWDMYDWSKNAIDPLAPQEGYIAHVFRGGSWRSTRWDCRCTRANFWIASHKSNDLGFRLVLGRPININECNKPLTIE